MKKQQVYNILKIAFAFCIFIFSTYNVRADNIVLSQPINSFLNISSYTSVYVDKSTSLDLEAIRDLQKQNAFIPLDSLQPDGKYIRGKHNYWLHFHLINKPEAELVRTVLHCGKYDQIDIYQIETGTVDRKEIGGGRKINGRPRLFPNKYSVVLNIAPMSSNDVFVKITCGLKFLKSPLFLLNEQYEFEQETKALAPYMMFHVAFFSLLVFVFLFTLPQYFQNKDKAFLYYSLYVLSLIFFYYRAFEISNPVLQFLPPGITDYKYYMPISLLPVVLYILFVSSFLDARKDFPKLYKFIKLSLYFCAIYLILDRAVFYFDKHMAWKMSHYIRVGYLIFSLYALLLLFRSKNILAKYILSGTLVLVLASLFNMLLTMAQTSSSINYWDTSLLSQYIGIGLELLFFSLGLGYKTRLLEAEKNTAQQKLENEKREKNIKKN